jgi:hypothetical protein
MFVSEMALTCLDRDICSPTTVLLTAVLFRSYVWKVGVASLFSIRMARVKFAPVLLKRASILERPPPLAGSTATYCAFQRLDMPFGVRTIV